MTKLTADRIREVLLYDPETGLFSHRIARGKYKHIKAGTVVGSSHSEGYIVIDVDRKLYFAHRLAWLYLYGEHPVSDVDHINGDRSDNRASNLRAASRAENMQNLRRVSKRSSSGLLGAYRFRKKWTTSIQINGAKKHLGVFDSAEEASAAYLAAKSLMHPFSTVTIVGPVPAASAAK
jgi:hypothetical protein